MADYDFGGDDGCHCKLVCQHRFCQMAHPAECGAIAGMKMILRLVLRLLFRFRTENESVLDTPGPVILLPNHSSWFDWLFLAACVDTRWRFVTSIQSSRRSWLHRLIMVNRFTFPVEPESPYSVKRMASFLHSGGRLVLFPEGRLSRTGALMKLFDGTGFLLFKTRPKVITCYIRGAYRLPYSPNGCHKRFFPRVSVHFGEVETPPIAHNTSTSHARAVLTHWLQDRMAMHHFRVEQRASPATILRSVMSAAHADPGKTVVQDFQRQSLSYRKLMVGVDILAARWLKLLPADPAERVGVLLPNANAMPVTLLSLWAVDKVPAVLNYSSGMAAMLQCCKIAGIRRVIASRRFMDKAKIESQPFEEAGMEMIYLEDVRKAVGKAAQAFSLLRMGLNLRLAERRACSTDTAVVLFTSGSEGPPKAVELTHSNILSNIWQMLSVVDLTEMDRFCDVLPPFHSFGLTIGMFLPLVRGCYVFLYPSPLHYLMVPTVFYDFDCTVFLSTNTFLNGYGRKAHPYDFRSLRLVFAGAEKLQPATADLWARRFGVRVLEGYGTTECSPCVSANTPLFPRFGSTGRLLPGMEYRLEPVEGVREGGRLWLRGPNIMKGYINPVENARFQSQGGWYDTGDIARVDEDGYLYLMGRIKRFAKISGEMVSLTAVEEALGGAFPEFGLHCELAVVAHHDAIRGESLVAVVNEKHITLRMIRAVLRDKGLNNLSHPRDIVYVSTIPKLGSGKTNHRELERMLAEQSTTQ
jgi:acyl-[acyl-carrier-protein]-phospholipid O-acyltransferase/long-chain-fatty-acid--[acyl-carrier-protein] ligase